MSHYGNATYTVNKAKGGIHVWNYSEYDIKVLPVFFGLLLFAAVVIALLLRDKPRWMRRIPTALIAIALLFLEVLKQRWNALGGFDPYMLPLHYCSLFAILIPLAELCGGWLSRCLRPAVTAMAFVVSVALYNCPGGIIDDACELFGMQFKPTHSFLFHHLVVFYLLLVVMMRLITPRLRDVWTVGLIGAVYAAVAIPLSYLFDANYCNYLKSVIPFLEELRLQYGQVAHAVIITLFITVGAMVGALIFTAIYRLIARCFPRNDSED